MSAQTPNKPTVDRKNQNFLDLPTGLRQATANAANADAGN